MTIVQTLFEHCSNHEIIQNTTGCSKQPVIDHLRKKYQSVPLEANLSVDEQVCATKVHHYMKQYNPMKPHKWGYKLFILSGISGFAYNFEINSGQENSEMLPNEPDLGASANVLRLSQIVPEDQHYQIYFDNYYTTLPLLLHLETKKIHSLVTIRRNRFPGLKLPEDKVLKKKPRGTSYENTATIDGTEVSVVTWVDNKIVTLASTFTGENPIGRCSCYDRKLKQRTEVRCPQAVEDYIKFMGGVNLLDMMMATHKISMKSKKWYFRIFHHLIDLTCVNAWHSW